MSENNVIDEALTEINEKQNAPNGVKDGKCKCPKIALLIGNGVFLLVVIALIVGSLAGFLSIVLKNPNQRVVLQTVVCDEDIISRHNDIPWPFDEEGQQILDGIIADIKANDNYDKDPTCQFIIWGDAHRKEDIAVLDETLGNIKELHSQGIFIDNNLNGVLPIQPMESMTDYIRDITSPNVFPDETGNDDETGIELGQDNNEDVE